MSASKLQLPADLTLAKLQTFVKQMVVERGFVQENPKDVFLLFSEEVGELARALRDVHGLKMADDTKRANLADELADCLLYLIDLANQSGIDLEEAVRQKEVKNSQRTWK